MFKEKLKKMRFLYRDLVWSIAVLVIFNITVVSIRLSDDQEPTNILSIGGSLISIILGIIAILISIIQNNSSITLNGNVSTTLELINKRLENIDNQINTKQAYTKESKDTNDLITDKNDITRLHMIIDSSIQLSGQQFVIEISSELERISQKYQLIDYSIKPLKIAQSQTFNYSTSISLLFKGSLQDHIIESIIQNALSNVGVNNFNMDKYINNGL